MPFVNIKVTGHPLTPEQVQRLQQGATGLMADVMRKVADLTAVLVEQVAVGSWTIGGPTGACSRPPRRQGHGRDEHGRREGAFSSPRPCSSCAAWSGRT